MFLIRMLLEERIKQMAAWKTIRSRLYRADPGSESLLIMPPTCILVWLPNQ